MSRRAVNLKESAQESYLRFAELAQADGASLEAIEDLRALDRLLGEDLAFDPTPEQFMLAGKLGGMRRIKVRNIAVCYAAFNEVIEVLSIIRISSGVTGHDVWNILLAAGLQEKALTAIGLQRYQQFFAPTKQTSSIQ